MDNFDPISFFRFNVTPADGIGIRLKKCFYSVIKTIIANLVHKPDNELFYEENRKKIDAEIVFPGIFLIMPLDI